MIPLRPELVEFLDPQGLCHYSCASKTLSNDVRDAKAWEILARAQLPRKTRELASDALSRVKSHVRRRQIADALGQETPAPATFTPNTLEDFTYFVRLEQDDVVIWEGDLQCQRNILWGHHLSLAKVWSDINQSEPWEDMAEFLTTPTDVDDYEGYLRSVGITVVAIRNDDQAMVALGHFRFNDAFGDAGAAEQPYIFRSRQTLFSLERFQLTPIAILRVTHDADGDGMLNAIELRLEHYSSEAVYHPNNPEGFIEYGDFDFKLRYLLSYLAGIHHRARGRALATIENWHVEAARVLGDSWPNYDSDYDSDGTTDGE